MITREDINEALRILDEDPSTTFGMPRDRAREMLRLCAVGLALREAAARMAPIEHAPRQLDGIAYVLDEKAMRETANFLRALAAALRSAT